MALALPLTVAAFPGDNGGFEGHHANRVERLTKSLDQLRSKNPSGSHIKEQEETFKIIR